MIVLVIWDILVLCLDHIVCDIGVNTSDFAGPSLAFIRAIQPRTSDFSPEEEGRDSNIHQIEHST